MNSTNPQADYGDADLDYPNRFTLAGTYLLPSKKSAAQMLQGWQVNWTVNVVSALVYNPYDPTSDLSGTGELADRWDIVGNVKDFSGFGQRTPLYRAGESPPALWELRRIARQYRRWRRCPHNA